MNAFIYECKYHSVNGSVNGQCCRAHIQALERSARAGEAECEAAVARRADIAKQQATAWQAAAQATAQLQTAQQQKAAKAAKQAQKVKERHFLMPSARNLTGSDSSQSTLLYTFGNRADRTQPFLHTLPRLRQHVVEIAVMQQQKLP